MSFDVPYERLNSSTKVDYIPLKLALNDLPDNGVVARESGDTTDATSENNEKPKIDIDVAPTRELQHQPMSTKHQMYDALVLGMLTFFCILVLLYALYWFVILRDRQKSIIKSSYMY